MKNKQKELKLKEELKRKQSNLGEAITLDNAIVAIKKSMYNVAVQDLKAHLTAESHRDIKQKNGDEIRYHCSYNKNFGHWLIKDAFGNGIHALANEVMDALKGKRDVGWLPISSSGSQVEYIKLAFQKESTTKHKLFGELPRYDGSTFDVPNVGIIGPKKKFVCLPLLTALLRSVLYFGLANQGEGEKLLFVKAALLRTKLDITEENWTDPKFHWDFDPLATQPLTYMLTLRGETPLDLGSLGKERTSRKKSNVLVLKCGDAIVFSSRQLHKTGRPQKFPTEENFRVHFMFSASRSDVVPNEDIIHLPSEQY